MSFSKPTYKPPTGSVSQKFQWWANSCYYSHELICGCNDFANHLLGTVSGLSRHDIKEAIENFMKQKRCLSTSIAAGGSLEPIGDTGPEEGEENNLIDGLEPDILERLFEDPLPTGGENTAG